MNKNTATIYINGESEASDEGTSDARGTNFALGALGVDDGYSSTFDGVIDDVRVYDRALSGDEIFQLYLYGTKGKDLRSFLDNRKPNI